VPTVAAQKQRCRASAVTSSYLQMTSVFNDAPALPKYARLNSSLPVFETPDTTTSVHTPAGNVGPTAGSEVVDTFACQNVSTLHQLGGCDMLLEICDASLVYLKRYRAYYEDEIKGSSRQESVINVPDAVAARLR
jgi:E3 ubiquitin-protein ligases UBR4 N-terminal